MGTVLQTLPVVRDRDGLQLAGDRPRLAVPDVVQIAEFERELRAGPCVQEEMDVTGGAIRRRPLVVVEQVDPDDAVGDFIPERRRVLDAGVDEVEPRAAIDRGLALGLPACEERGRQQQDDQDSS